DVGFGPLLFDAKHFMDRIEGAKVRGMEGKLINLATDGESYGHHKAFGDRALAYLLNIEAPKRGFRVTNYAEFLAGHPPHMMVRIKDGENGEGTSWSCAHGLRRWKEHCGCRGEGPSEWTQHWRRPLRESFDWLRDECYKLFENYGSRYLKDIWAARDDYIHVVLNRSEENIRSFLGRHAKFELKQDEIVTVLKLLEIQRQAMLMYTSCGWFFTEISGIETVQILTYAARAVDLAYQVSGKSLEEEFLEHLAHAKSNRRDLVDGRGVYEKLVKPRMVSFEHVVSYYAILSSFEYQEPPQETFNLYCYRMQVLHQHREFFGSLTFNFGRVRLTSRVTLEEHEYVFLVFQIGPYDFRCSVKPFAHMADPEVIERELFEELHSTHIVEIFKKIDVIFGEKCYTLKDLPMEQRMRIVSILTKEMIEKIRDVHETLYDENRRISEIYRSMNLSVPEEIRSAAEQTLGRRLMRAIMELRDYGFDPKRTRQVSRIIDDAKLFEIELVKSEVVSFLNTELEKRTEDLVRDLTPELVVECLNIHKLAKKMNIKLDQRKTQDNLYFLIKKWQHHPQTIPPTLAQCANNFMQLLTDNHINTDVFSKLIEGYSPPA
ncbi:MAG: DUF3536 domain-containing protein, partial [Candidatus Omnitrophica bacterium]|nr:DUF3536 domain-containing protein [Candidatus Omnitrophota bacterium]